ncbi:hypothetical protein FC83_GL000707 [Agrilactobacillus composti DSM 18527 = JCM 14202]|uniref:Uncharacterized protein n=1 Tax=Agrilactobacillus composti DSM 18527 = JCM 14202 TaxID=1423734 RepID=X0PNZ3_9LACO|nr:hypothetical protein [Agrilactobacillus composti]KRM31640.1 hypothetical protein FC83_GL000707 [Agrilactobacillus composti DSM 18527 = JCM 14202]GAF39327.1 hypothetical protein JCM14202_1183 [Agrilactobacillus composti DSM 18527 = JCM 14202]
MADKFVKIDQLAKESQGRAVKKFIEFYLGLFKNRNLDVLSEQDHQDIIVAINNYIFDNISFTREQLIARLFADRYAEFVVYLTEIDQTYTQDGLTTKQSWPDWLADKEKHIDTKEALS